MFQNVKIFFLLFVLVSSGYACKPKEVIKIVEIKIPCIVPKVECNFDGKNNVETVAELIRCVYAHREAAKACQ